MSSTPSLASLHHRLTSTSQLLLERSRVVSLKLTPSASSTNTIVRNLSAIKTDLQRIEDDLEANGLKGSPATSSAGTAVSKGKNKSKGLATPKESEVEKQVREVGESYDRLVAILGEDEGGRERSKTLVRER
jgi:syntaxin 8